MQRMQVTLLEKDEETLDIVIWGIQDLAETAIELVEGREGCDEDWMQWALGEIEVRKYGIEEKKQRGEGRGKTGKGKEADREEAEEGKEQKEEGREKGKGKTQEREGK